MRIQNRTKLVVARALLCLAVLALVFASSAQTLAQSPPAQEPKKQAESNHTGTVTIVAVDKAEARPEMHALPVQTDTTKKVKSKAESERAGTVTVVVDRSDAKPETHTFTVQSNTTQDSRKKAAPNRVGKIAVSAGTLTPAAVEERLGVTAGTGTLTLEGDANAAGGLVTRTVTIVGVVEQLPKTLDQALTAAMERNPDIATARAKLALAEAELNGTQMDVARKIVAKWTEFQTQTRHCNDLQKLVDAKSANTGELIAAKASLDRMEADLRYLVGQSASRSLRIDSAGAAPPRETTKSAPVLQTKSALVLRGPAKPLQLPRGPMVERIRQAMLAPSHVDFNDQPLQDVVDYLKSLHKIEIQLDKQTLEDVNVTGDTPMTANVKAPSLGALFQWLDDQHPELKFVVRDYGILVTTPERAREQGYLPVVEFARVSQVTLDIAPAVETQPARKPPAANIQKQPATDALKPF